MFLNTGWESPPARIDLPENGVHLWLASLHLSPERLKDSQNLLSPDELSRARRFAFDKDRNRYIAVHGILRTLIGQYVDVHPAHIAFQKNEYGKPFLQHGHTPISFNISYSHYFALYAFTGASRQIGIDIEYLDPEVDCKSIAQSMFSPGEIKRITPLTDDDLLKMFFTIWARKEAYIKAHGEGLSLKLDEFDVLQDTENWNQIIDSNGSIWTVKDLAAPRNFAAAIAIEGQMLATNCWHYPVE